MSTEIITTVAAAVWKLYKKDRNNKYILLKDAVVDIKRDIPFTYDGKHLSIQPSPKGAGWTRVTAKAPGVCDGATGVPDKFCGVVEAAIFHDAWYDELERIVAEWIKIDPDVSVAYVRNLGDFLFGAIMTKYKSPVSRLYYKGVRYLGGIFLTIREWLPLLVCSGLLSLQGCIIIETPTEDDIDIVIPTVYSNAVTGAVSTGELK